MEGGEAEWDVYLAGDEHDWDVDLDGCEPSRAVLSSSHIKLVNEDGHYFIMPRELTKQSFRLAGVMQLSGESISQHLFLFKYPNNICHSQIYFIKILSAWVTFITKKKYPNNICVLNSITNLFN